MIKKRVFNLILSVTAAIVLYGALALLFDFYYDLNDDVMIKDILSGIYTGKPDAHNNQMLYPISVLFAGLYRSNSRAPWFGLIMIGLMILSLVIILKSLLLFMDIRMGDSAKNSVKVVFTAAFAIIYSALMIWEIINVQYTVVAGMLTAAAAVRLYCGDPVGVSDDEQDRDGDCHVTPFEMKTFIRMNIPSIILVVVAFNIRSELVLLLSPMLAAVAIAKWSEETGRKKAYVICAYLGVFLSICTLMAGSLSIDGIAYSSSEWNEYRDFFDARTELYDFTGVPNYDDNAAFYEEEGISREQYDLLINYNYYEDSRIDADLLKRIVNGVKDGRATGRSTYNKSIREAAWEYVHNMINIMSTDDVRQDHIFADEAGQHRPFNLIVIILYIALIISGCISKDKTVFIKIPSLLVLRTIPWMYIYLKGRVLGRITHPLYIIEIVFLMAMLLNEEKENIKDIKSDNRISFVFIAAMTVLSVVCLAVFPGRVKYISASQTERANVNVAGDKLYSFTSSDKDTYYYIDTYSTVDLTEKIFGTKKVTKINTQLLGGWMGNSPLDSYKKNLCSKEEIISKDEFLALTEDSK